jgi:hypothetical protein
MEFFSEIKNDLIFLKVKFKMIGSWLNTTYRPKKPT